MVMPAATTMERNNIDTNTRTICRSLLTTLENLTWFNEFIKTIPNAPTDALLDPPYSYDADQAYALRLWGERAAVYAAAFEDDAQLKDLTRRYAGVMLITNQGM